MRKPPKHIYGMEAVFRAAESVDKWGKVVWRNIPVRGVNVQPSHDTVRSKDNTEVKVKAVIFVDSLYSSPFADLVAIKNESEGNGHQMTVMFGGEPLTVVAVDTIYNEYCAIDHYEVLCE